MRGLMTLLACQAAPRSFFLLCSEEHPYGRSVLRLFWICGLFGAIGTWRDYGLQVLVQIQMGTTFPYGLFADQSDGVVFSLD